MSDSKESKSTLRILVIDDEESVAELLTVIVEDLGCAVKWISDGKLTNSELSAFQPDVVFLDLCMPGTDGIDVLQILAECQCPAAIVLISGMQGRALGAAKSVADIEGLNVLSALNKPFRIKQVQELLRPLIALKSAA